MNLPIHSLDHHTLAELLVGRREDRVSAKKQTDEEVEMPLAGTWSVHRESKSSGWVLPSLGGHGCKLATEKTLQTTEELPTDEEEGTGKRRKTVAVVT